MFHRALDTYRKRVEEKTLLLSRKIDKKTQEKKENFYDNSRPQ